MPTGHARAVPLEPAGRSATVQKRRAFVKTFRAIAGLLLVAGCSGENTSDVRADYETVRLKQLVLTDAGGKPVLTLTAERRSGGLPTLIVRGTNGSVLRTIELEAPK